MNLNRPYRSVRYSWMKLSRAVRCACAVRISRNSSTTAMYTPNVTVTVLSVIVGGDLTGDFAAALQLAGPLRTNGVRIRSARTLSSNCKLLRRVVCSRTGHGMRGKKQTNNNNNNCTRFRCQNVSFTIAPPSTPARVRGVGVCARVASALNTIH